MELLYILFPNLFWVEINWSQFYLGLFRHCLPGLVQELRAVLAKDGRGQLKGVLTRKVILPTQQHVELADVIALSGGFVAARIIVTCDGALL